jgi:hypothetical protein
MATFKIKVVVRNVPSSPYEVKVSVTGPRKTSLVKQAYGTANTVWNTWANDAGDVIHRLAKAAQVLTDSSYVDEFCLLVDAKYSVEPEI